MCNPALIAMAVGTGVSLAGQRSQAKAMKRAQEQRMIDDMTRSQREFVAGSNRDRQIFGAQQGAAARAAARDDSRLKALDLAMQSKSEIANDQGDMEVAQAARVADAGTAIANTESAGLQSVGSGVSGRVSGKSEQGNAEASASSKEKAMARAKDKAALGAFSDISRDNVRAITDAGVNSSALKISIDRRRAIDDLFTQAAINQAIVENRVSPDPVRVYDGTSKSGQLLSALGSGISSYGAYGGFNRGPSTTTGAGSFYTGGR